MSTGPKGGPAQPQRIAITGASGFVGSALASHLTKGGHSVIRIGRGETKPGPDVVWSPEKGILDGEALEGVSGVVHLAGASVAQRWSADHKRAIRDSRVQGTRLLATTLARLRTPPSVLLSMSAVGIYGNRGAERLDETSSTGKGFLADVARQWEGAADSARAAGIRVVHPRTGIVLNPRGGALERLVPIFNLGAGGKIGGGDQYMSWIALTDVVRALVFLLDGDSLGGPVNLTAPAPATNAEFSRTLGRVMHRPVVATVPEFAIRLAFGEMGEETLLGGQQVIPKRLTDAGFAFSFPTLEGALAAELAAPAPADA